MAEEQQQTANRERAILDTSYIQWNRERYNEEKKEENRK
jgi:hypothetical protein